MLGGQIAFAPDFLAFLNRANGQNAASSLQQKRTAIKQQQQQLESKDRLATVNDLLGKLKPKLDSINSTRAEVTIEGFPFNVNRTARAFPFATFLTVQCASGQVSLANYNFPPHEAFIWCASGCGVV